MAIMTAAMIPPISHQLGLAGGTGVGARGGEAASLTVNEPRRPLTSTE